MHIPPELLPVIQITLPLLVGLFIAAWLQNRAIDQLSKRIDDVRDGLGKRIDDVLTELREIRAELKTMNTRIIRLEERIPPLIHR